MTRGGGLVGHRAPQATEGVTIRATDPAPPVPVTVEVLPLNPPVVIFRSTD